MAEKLVESTNENPCLIIFPGLNTPLKRYRSYFSKYDLRQIRHEDRPSVVLCHSIGIIDALNYCEDNKLETTIICMDGVDLYSANYMLDGVKLAKLLETIHIVMFRPENKRVQSDSKYEVIRYTMKDDSINHYPYMDKKTRDRIIEQIEKYSIPVK